MDPNLPDVRPYPKLPYGITSPMKPPSKAVKNSRPSGQAIIHRAPAFGSGIEYSPTTVPSGFIRPILLAKFAVYQMSPSGAIHTPRRDELERVSARLYKPNATVSVCSHRARLAVVAGDRILCNFPFHCNAANPIAGRLTKPDHAIAACNG